MGSPYDLLKWTTHVQTPIVIESHGFTRIRMCWTVGLRANSCFDIKSFNLWTTDEGIGSIRLTSNLISRLAPLGSFDPPLSQDKYCPSWASLSSPHCKTVRTVLTSSILCAKELLLLIGPTGIHDDRGSPMDGKIYMRPTMGKPLTP